MRSLSTRVLAAADTFEPRGLPLAITRSTLAVAELAGIVFTPDSGLFIHEAGLTDGMRCTGLRGLSLWCVAGPSSAGLLVSRVVAIVVLVVAASGYRPRWTCVPQWFVTAGLTASLAQPYGADTAAVLATLLLIPMLLGDDRTWHWTRPTTPLAPMWRGSSYAAWLALRCQIVVIYLDAAISKMTVPQWRAGTAMYTVFVDPNYGLPLAVRHALSSIVSSPVVIAPLTWGVIALELGIAVCALASRRARRIGVVLAVLLHGGIVLTVGLFSFGAVMMALVLTLCLGDGRTSERSGDHADSVVRSAGGVRA
jgi:antimicrobial peptide system SdpB family protein